MFFDGVIGRDGLCAFQFIKSISDKARHALDFMIGISNRALYVPPGHVVFMLYMFHCLNAFFIAFLFVMIFSRAIKNILHQNKN